MDEADAWFFPGARLYAGCDRSIRVGLGLAKNCHVGNIFKSLADTAAIHPFFLNTLFVDVRQEGKQVFVLGELAPEGVESVVACVALGRIGVRQNFYLLFSALELVGDFLARSASQ